jgi:hypothetical protein
MQITHHFICFLWGSALHFTQNPNKRMFADLEMLFRVATWTARIQDYAK